MLQFEGGRFLKKILGSCDVSDTFAGENPNGSNLLLLLNTNSFLLERIGLGKIFTF
jgi:hypothetical protein